MAILLSICPFFAEQSIEAKRLKVETDSTSATSVVVPSPMIISDALAKFFGTSEKEMLQTEATNRVWEYIKVNNLEVGTCAIFAWNFLTACQIKINFVSFETKTCL